MKPRKSLQQMTAEANGEQPMQIAGKPATVCPYCGAGMFVQGTRDGEAVTFRYVKCRSCDKTFYSKQANPPPPVIIREIGAEDEPSSAGRPALTLVRHSA